MVLVIINRVNTGQTVAKNISKFPSHTARLLTSTVVECQRAGLKNAAYEYATVLMRPEYRAQIEPKFKRKIEALIRRPDTAAASSSEDRDAEPLSPCPISGHLIAETELECPTTKEPIPMCVVTGKHMVLDDWAVCPNSRMPALYSAYVEYFKAEQQRAVASSEAKGGDIPVVLDPVCSQPITLDQIKLLPPDEATKILENWRKI